MKEAVAGNGHPATIHAEFEVSPRSAANLLHQFRYRLQNNRTVRRAKHTVERAAHYVHDHSPRFLAAEVQRLVRQRPGAALAVAAVAGFLIGRSLRRR
jgi:ElaB/YqjD/DUF883 family membrane-anchored ribosome-binding protein